MKKIVVDKHFENGWNGFPEGIKKAYISFYRGEDSIILLDVLKILKVHMDTFDAEKKDVVRWINRLFADCLFPLELHEEEWKIYDDELVSLLRTEEAYLEELTGDITVIEPRCDPMQLDSLTVCRQNLEIFYSVFFWYEGDIDLFNKHMDTALACTDLNISYLLHQENAQELFASEYRDDDFYIHGLKYWEEPLAFIIAEAYTGGFMQDVIPYYEAYMKFLKEQVSTVNLAVLRDLLNIAENTLKRLYSEAKWESE